MLYSLFIFQTEILEWYRNDKIWRETYFLSNYQLQLDTSLICFVMLRNSAMLAQITVIYYCRMVTDIPATTGVSFGTGEN